MNSNYLNQKCPKCNRDNYFNNFLEEDQDSFLGMLELEIESIQCFNCCSIWLVRNENGLDVEDTTPTIGLPYLDM